MEARRPAIALTRSAGPRGRDRLSRREALRRLGVLAAGGALAGCAARSGAMPLGRAGRFRRSLGAGGRSWTAVEAAADRVTRTLVGLRPYRPAGFVVRTDVLDGKPIVHNYGHGGGGITLSWGTAHLALEEASRTGHREAAVLGCGAVGLATARLLQRNGWRVRIYARELPPETTSNIAAGQWAPFSVYSDDAVDAAFMARFRRAARLAFRHFQDLVGPDYGVRWIDNFIVSDRPIVASSLQRDMPDLFPGVRDLEPDEHPFPVAHARRVITMIVETSRYLRRMEADVRLAGAGIVIRDFREVAEVVALPEPVVINCTGLGARELFGDRDLIPARGQLEVLLPQPEIDYILLRESGLYMMPRSDGIVLGGTFERDDWSLEPDTATSRRIVSGHEAFFEAMKERLAGRA